MDPRVNNWVSEQQSRLRSDSPVLGYPDIPSSYNPLLSPSPNYTRDLSTDQEQQQVKHERDLSAFLNDPAFFSDVDGRDKPLPPPPSSSPRPVPKPLIIPSSISRRSSHQSFSTTPSRRSSRFPSISSTLDEISHSHSPLHPEDVAQRTPTVDSAFRLPRTLKPIDTSYSPAMTNLTTPTLSPTTSTFSGTTASSQVFLGSSSPYESSPASSSSLHSAFSYRVRGRSSTFDLAPPRASEFGIGRKQSAPALYGRQFDFDYEDKICPEEDAPGASKWSLGSSLDAHVDSQIPSPDPSINKEKKGKRQRLLSLVSRFATPTSSPLSPSPATTVPPSPTERPRTLSTSISLGMIGRTKSLSASGWHKRKLIVRGIAENDQKACDAVRAWCETFGEVRRFSRKPDGDLHINFKKSSVADTVCRLETRVFIKGAGSVSLSWYQGKYSR